MKEYLPILVFYINIDGMSRQQAVQTIHMLMEEYKKEFPIDQYKHI